MDHPSPAKPDASVELTPSTTAIDTSNDTKRRSSSRSIKRKRFDDEIVQYSIGVPSTQITRIGRSRRQSVASAANTPSTSIAPSTTTSPQTHKISSEPVAVAPIAPQTTTTTAQATVSAASTAANEISSATPPTPTAPSVEPQLNCEPIKSDLVQPNTVSQIQQKQVNANTTPVPVTTINTTMIPQAPSIQTTTIVPSTVSSPAPLPEKRRSAKTMSHSKKAKKHRKAEEMQNKGLGRWKPIDDLSLIIGIQQTNDLRVVHQAVKFSCKFTFQEMQNRWYSLLYDEPISRIAVAAMRNLHPEVVESVHAKALYTTQEEELLGTIKSSANDPPPREEMFQELLDKNAHIFYPARTAKALMHHWNLMKQYMLLPDQQIITNKNLFHALPDGDLNINFCDQEDKLNDADLTEARDEALELELALADRKCKKEIRHLENELPRWQVLVDSITGIGIHPDFDNHTLAVLRGRIVRYLMRSREITLGRNSEYDSVDVDLLLEGPAQKVSRRQGTIKLRSNGDFFITNEGKRPLFIDGVPLLNGNKTKLNNNCTIEIAGLRVVFMINVELINAIRLESAKMNGPLN